MRDSVKVAIIAVIMIALWGLIGFQYMECSHQGGEFVRGLFWFRCLL